MVSREGLIILLTFFLGGCTHKAAYIHQDFTLKDKRIAILPFAAKEIEYQKEMAESSNIFFKEMEKRNIYKLISPDWTGRFLEKEGYEIKEVNFEAIGRGLDTDYLLIGEITRWSQYKHRPRGIFLPGFQSYTEVEMRIRLWEVAAGRVVYEDVDGLKVQGDYGKGHLYVSYEEVARQISRNFINNILARY